MKTKISLIGAALLCLVLTSADCNKGTDPAPSTKPTVPSISFSLPGTQDPCSQTANTIVAFVDSNTTLLAIFATFEPQVSGNDYIWTFPSALTVTVKATRQGDNSFAWEVRFNGTDGQTTYSNKLILSGTTANAEATSGNMIAYSDTSSAQIGRFEWSTSGDVVTGTLYEKDSTQTDVYKVVIKTYKSSKAGEVTTYAWIGSAWVQQFHAVWTSEGAQATCN